MTTSEVSWRGCVERQGEVPREEKQAVNIDLSVYLVTDRRLLEGRQLVDVVAAAVEGGVTCVQLREKEAAGREFISLAQELLEVTRPAGVPLIINDRVDVAVAADADGAHVGQEDIPAAAARKILGPDKILGVTVSTPEEALRAANEGADYVGSSAVFATPTKTDSDKPIGIEGLRRLCEASPVPVVAIGGVDAGNAGEMIRVGAAGVAVVRAIMAAPDPKAAAQHLREVVEKARRSL
ncbi:MAG: thiamine phosphate synthase [Armatimonadetes bacterium]|nr:thiamine phosphate synthase [Armatimonadota bacterium]